MCAILRRGISILMAVKVSVPGWTVVNLRRTVCRMLTPRHRHAGDDDERQENQPETRVMGSAEDLDLRARTTRPHSWLALLVTAVGVGLLVAWAFLATIPQVMKGSGALTDIRSEQQVSAPLAGQIVGVFATPGQLVQAGELLVQLVPSASATSAPSAGKSKSRGATSYVTIPMPVTGQVRDITAIPGAFVTAGQELMVVAPVTRGTVPIFAVVYVSVPESTAFQAGQSLPLDLDVGGFRLLGTVVTVGELPATTTEIAEVYNNPDRAQGVFDSTGGAPIAITFDLGIQPQWVGDPAPYPLVAGMLVSITLQTSNPHPIDLLLN